MRTALALLATLLIVAPAQAASTKVTWPEARRYGPGEQIAVSVQGDRKVNVSVLRVSASGKVMETVARRTLKRGSVTATLKRAGTYSVRVDRRQRKLKVVTATSGDPAPPMTTPGDCTTPPAVELRLSADRVTRGEVLKYSIVNASGGCITSGAGFQLEHQQADGTWRQAPWQLLFPLYAVMIPAGGEFAKNVSIPSDAPLGMYRIIETGGFTEPTFEVVA